MEKYVYRKSFIAKLVLERNLALDAYNEIKNEINKYEGIDEKTTFEYEYIIINKQKIGLITMSRKKLNVFLDYNPEKLAKKYKAIDASNFAKYKKYPSRFIIEDNKMLENVVALIKRLIKENEGFEKEDFEEENYFDILYERSFLELFNEGLIKQYLIKSSKTIRKVKEDKDVEEIEEDDEEMHKVNFVAKLLYCAKNQAENLYIVTNVNDWNTYKALKMKKVSDNEFEAYDFFKKGTKLEFKICRDVNWDNVEKGIWKEEIVNHHYIVNDDLNVEDLIHNFREN